MRIRPALQALIGKLQPRRPRPVILMYHRIAEALIDPWDLAVSPDRFAEQLDCLRRSRHPLRLSEFIARLRDGTLPDDAVAVTFDDGYADNFLAAKPRSRLLVSLQPSSSPQDISVGRAASGGMSSRVCFSVMPAPSGSN